MPDNRLQELANDPLARNVVDPSLYSEDPMKRMGAGASMAAGYANALGMGIPEMIAKLVAPKAVEQGKAEYPVASGAGNIAGTVASAFTPAGAVSKAASAGANALGLTKAAEKLAEMAKIAKAGNGIKAGAIQAAEQAVPRAVTQTAIDAEDNKDVGKSAEENLKNATLGIAAGGVAGGVAGGALGKLGSLAEKAAGKTTADIGPATTYLHGLGMSADDINQVSTYGWKGHAETAGAQKFQQNAVEMAQYLKANGVNSAKDLPNFLAKSKSLADRAEPAYNQAPPNEIYDKALGAFRASPAYKDSGLTPEQADAVFSQNVKNAEGNLNPYEVTIRGLEQKSNLAGKASESGNIQDVNQAVSKQKEAALFQAASKAVRDAGFDQAAKDAPEIAGDLKNLRDNWGSYLAANRAQVNNNATAMKGGKLGQAATMIGKSALGAGAGNIVGSMPGTDENTRLMAPILGAVLPNAPGLLKNFNTSMASKFIPKEVPGQFGLKDSDAAQKLAGAVQALQPVSQKGSGLVPGALAQNGQQVSGAIPSASVASAGGQEGPKQEIGQRNVGTFAARAPLSMGGDKIDAGELSADPDSMYMQRIMNTLNLTYNRYVPTDNNGKPLMTKQQWFEKAKQATNGFDPTTSGDAIPNLLSNDPKEKAILSNALSKVQILNQMGNLESALDKGNAVMNAVPQAINPAFAVNPEANLDYNNLVALLGRLQSPDGNTDPSPTEAANAKRKIDSIIALNKPNSEKVKILMDTLNQNRLPLRDLKAMGILKNTPIERYIQ